MNAREVKAQYNENTEKVLESLISKIQEQENKIKILEKELEQCKKSNTNSIEKVNINQKLNRKDEEIEYLKTIASMVITTHGIFRPRPVSEIVDFLESHNQTIDFISTYNYTEFQIIDSEKLKCTIDGEGLKYKLIKIAKYADRKKELVVEWIVTYGYVCEKCNRAYLTHQQYNPIKVSVKGIKKFNQVIYDNTNKGEVSICKSDDSKENILLKNGIDKNIIKAPTKSENNYVKSVIDSSKLRDHTRFQLISKKKLKCVVDGTQLNLRRVKLATYTSRKCTTIKDWVIIEGYECSRCNKLYLIDSQIDELKNRSIEKVHVKSTCFEVISSMKVQPANSAKEAGLNSTSALAQLGYTTTISKEARWNILRNRAIPQLGVDRTKNIIKHLINYNGKSERQQRALSEWKYDLERMERMY